MMHCRQPRLRARHTFSLGALVLTALAMTGCNHANLTQSDSVVAEQSINAGLRASYSLASADVTASDDVTLQLTLQNTGDQSAAFLPFNTAFESPLFADVFDVLLAGESLPYLGSVAARLPVQASDVLTLEAGDQLESTVVLSEYYSLNEPGTYEIRYTPKPITIDPSLGIELAEMADDTSVVYLTVR